MQSNRSLCSCMDWHHADIDIWDVSYIYDADQQISISLVMATTTMIVDTSTLRLQEGSLSPESGGCWSGSEAHRSSVCLWDDGARDPLLLIGDSSTDVLGIRNRRATRWVRARHSYVWYGIYSHIESVLIGPGISGGDNWTKWVTVWGFNVTSTIDTILLLLWVI